MSEQEKPAIWDWGDGGLSDKTLKDKCLCPSCVVRSDKCKSCPRK